ncbi:MAG: bifunctional precorrin-2 dehydrogenase/sirohydrochlorin ferrochelatase [Candidatus Caenarcaniphilales bacterium]|nr:bifunctional precorrin-2 dehydrogenase/sirohydrochlorin ferrochelatase [Candidatus Caenarcaniphilales bacterium]
MSLNPLYPIFLKLKDRKVLIIGGGFIALQKIQGLLNTEANITVIAPKICQEIYDSRGEFPNIRKIEILERDYAYGDEIGSFIVIAATDEPEVNNMIVNRCRDQMIIANSVDQPDYCDFYVPSIIESGSIKVAISTNGKAPSVAQKLRLDLTALIEQRYKNVVDIVNEFRLKVKNKILGEENFERRAKLIRWFTTRTFRRIRNARINAALIRAKRKKAEEKRKSAES